MTTEGLPWWAPDDDRARITALVARGEITADTASAALGAAARRARRSGGWVAARPECSEPHAASLAEIGRLAESLAPLGEAVASGADEDLAVLFDRIIGLLAD